MPGFLCMDINGSGKLMVPANGNLTRRKRKLLHAIHLIAGTANHKVCYLCFTLLPVYQCSIGQAFWQRTEFAGLVCSSSTIGRFIAGDGGNTLIRLIVGFVVIRAHLIILDQ